MIRLSLAAALAAGPAFAQAPCADRTQIEQRLAAHYDEAPAFRGLDAAGRMVEFWISGDGETWTLTVTAPHGESCIVSLGGMAERLDRPAQGDPL